MKEKTWKRGGVPERLVGLWMLYGVLADTPVVIRMFWRITDGPFLMVSVVLFAVDVAVTFVATWLLITGTVPWGEDLDRLVASVERERTKGDRSG
jgi:hypothetical protein